MENKRALNSQIVEEAAGWAVKIEDGPLSNQERIDLSGWLKASPVHVEELLMASALLAGAAHVDPDKKILIERIMAEDSAEVVSLRAMPLASGPELDETGETAGQRVPKWAPFAGGLIAATLLLSVVLGPLSPLLYPDPSDEYTTALGEQRTITLADGSLVHINTKTHLRVNYRDDARTIEVIDGEALFDVEKDTDRPFRVITGNAVAEALGTKFNVRHLGDDTVVSVLEGRVAVAKPHGSDGASVLPDPIVLSDGEGIKLAENDTAPRKTKTDVQALTAWRKRQLVFESHELSAILFEFNRYNTTQLVTSDTDLARQRFSGVFDADDPDSFIAFLKLARDIHTTKIGNEIQLYAN